MSTFVESRLEFVFDENWQVERWDEQPAYRSAGGFASVPGTSACDFLGRHAAAPAVYLIEVKNFTEYHHANRDKPTSAAWAETLAAKVRDTLAGALWTRGRSFDEPPIRALVDDTFAALLRDKPALRVVFWVEDRPPLDPAVASALEMAIRRHLVRWFRIGNVRVTSRSRFDPAWVPGLTVRPAGGS